MAECLPCGKHSGIERDIAALSDKMDEREKQVNIQLAAMSKAIEVAKAAQDFRLEGMNEIRRQLTDQARTFSTNERVDGLFEKVFLKIDMLERFVNQRRGSLRWSDYLIAASIAAAAGVLARLLLK